MLIAIYSSRVLLRYLGIDDFGLYGLVGSIIAIFASLKSTFAASVQRFLNMNRTDSKIQNRIFSMGMKIHFIIAILFIVLAEIAGIIFLPHLNIDIDKLPLAYSILHFTILSASIVVISVPYDALIISNEKFDAFAIVSIIDAILRLGAIFLLVFSPISRVVFYSILLLCISVIYLLLVAFYCKRTFREVSNFHLFKDIELLREMTCFAGWNFWGNLGYYLTSEGVNFILNIFGGIVANASRTIAYQVKNALQAFLSDVTVAFQPQSMMAYVNDRCRFYDLQFLAAKIRFSVCVIIGFPIFMFIPELLQIWLGEQPEGAATFIRCILFFIVVRCWHDAVDITFKSAARMKNYQLCEIFVMLFNLPISCGVLFLGSPLYTVFIVMVMIELINLIVIMNLARREVDFRMTDYIRRVIVPSILIICILALVYICYSSFCLSFGDCLIVVGLAVVCSLGALGLIFVILLNPSERKSILSIMKH